MSKKIHAREAADWIATYQPVNFEIPEGSEAMEALLKQLSKVDIRTLKAITRALDHCDDLIREGARTQNTTA